MSAMAHAQTGADQTDIPFIARASVKLAILQSVFILVIALASRLLDGSLETVALAVLITAGVLATTILPGLWTRARSIEGIAGAAGIGLAATWIFLLVDVSLFQPFGLWTSRWREIGGGSNWWYHPVWWMVGTYLPWLGAWVLSNQTARNGTPSPAGLVASSLALTLVCAVVAVVVGFPGARWNLGTFGLAFLPGLALASVVSALGARRR
jgi:hypothetical protein